MKKIKFSTEQIKSIIDSYEKSISCKEIGKLFDCSKQTINKLLKENNIKLRNRSHCQQKYKINEHIFDKIDTQEKAYWLGILMGDGWVVGTHFGLSLQIIDKDHIFKFKQFLNSEHQISIKNNKNKKDGTESISYEIRIWNSYIVNTLKRYNICANKTKVAIFPTNIPEVFIPNYMLGLIDGDGCFTVKHKYTLCFGFVSTEQFTKKFQEVLIKNCDLNKTKLGVNKKTDFIRTVNYSGNKQLLKICKFLYNDATIFLPRKKKKSIEFLLSRYPKNEWLINMSKTLNNLTST